VVARWWRDEEAAKEAEEAGTERVAMWIAMGGRVAGATIYRRAERGGPNLARDLPLFPARSRFPRARVSCLRWSARKLAAHAKMPVYRARTFVARPLEMLYRCRDGDGCMLSH